MKVLLLALFALLLVYFAPGDSDDAAPVAAMPTAVPTPHEPVAAFVDLQLAPRDEESDLGDLFATPVRPVPAPLTKAASAPTTADGAPPLPFRFLGRLLERGQASYFLQVQGRNLVARVGDTLEGGYTLEHADDGALTFTYLPLHLQQSLAMGEVK